MAPAGRLVLCEEKIRGKTGLAPHRGLAELRSLSIPGTYQEKITHLGNSLMNLTGLKSLDLSRNSLVSLEGIEYLAALERLNVYRNRISSLAEVFRLHSLTELAEVDFRLNPVVESTPDYRLSVVHVLPRLRQLDDRPVRESERKASRLHFASEESLDSTQSFPAVFRVERPHHSRAKCTDPSAKKGLVMDADDEAVLNLIAECEWDLSNPPGSMSSSQQEQEASFQSSQESRPLSSPESAQHQCGDALRKGPETRRSGSSGGRAGPRVQDQRCGELPPRHLAPRACRVHVQEGLCPFSVADSTDTEDSAPSSQKSSLLTQKGLNPLPAPEKYRKRRVPGGRFQAPADQERLRCLEESLSRQSGPEGWSAGPCSHSAALGPEQRRPPSVSERCHRSVLLEAHFRAPRLSPRCEGPSQGGCRPTQPPRPAGWSHPRRSRERESWACILWFSKDTSSFGSGSSPPESPRAVVDGASSPLSLAQVEIETFSKRAVGESVPAERGAGALTGAAARGGRGLGLEGGVPRGWRGAACGAPSSEYCDPVVVVLLERARPFCRVEGRSLTTLGTSALSPAPEAERPGAASDGGVCADGGSQPRLLGASGRPQGSHADRSQETAAPPLGDSFAAPPGVRCCPRPTDVDTRAGGGEARKKPRSWFVSVQVCPKLHLAVPPGKKATLEVALLGLVEDRRWGGCRPRRSSDAFLVSWPRALRAGARAPLLGAGPRVSLDRLTGLTAALRCGNRPDGPIHSVWALGRWQTRRTPRGLWLSFPTCWRSGLPGARARHILSSVRELTATQDRSTTVNEEISSLTVENKSLQSRLAELQQPRSVTMSDVVSELSDTRKEMDHLRQHLDRTLEESSSLKSLLFSVIKEVRNADAPSTLNLQIAGLQTSVKRLSGEIVELKQHLEHYDRIHELTQMLQESHRSLVSTNEHLLRELGRARAQHQAEAEQLRWSYRQLKKTTAPLPSRPPAPAPAPAP
ncbi:LOW QUALITY PROTEIN: centrosomal protein of 72 kDa [Eubalaena glacialis]|uniref:LOW QUALITY PROTEIN: centrosomal protein of 72 kDa n=1 Tax=Eubalaena glacialis TaxID=27606 RepID=UPI002A5A0EC5|nr:LOW QUALITY PROTEIN: centrosomal protein of 72 kDa [Eubalaena glacialis]